MESVLGKQQALVRLMSSEPSLLSGLDDELLNNITLLADGGTMKHKRSERHVQAPRKNIQLYAENAGFAEKPTAITSSKRAALNRAGTVLLSPASNATAIAATESAKQVTRAAQRNAVTSIAPVVLLEDGALSRVGANTKKKTRKAKRRARKKSGSGTSSSEDDGHQAKREMATDDSDLLSSYAVNGSVSCASDSDEGPQIANLRRVPPPSPDTKASSASRILLDPLHFVARDQWIPRSSRKACYVCMRDFNVLRKRHSCRMCGEVICSRCSVFREVNLPVVDNKFRICSCCFVAYRKRAEESELASPDAVAGMPYPSTGDLVDPAQSPIDEVSPALSPGNFNAIPILQAPPSDTTSDHSSSRNTSNTTSELSFSSDSTFDMANYLSGSFSAPRSTEEELEAVLKAKQLEKEVEASQQRIEALEAQIALQESQKDLLSTEQQAQLRDARATIKLLQEKLRIQELSAKQAAYNRDSICLSKLRQTELYASEDDESAALRKKLKVLERQLKQAGISVAEVIPYEVAKRKVQEISRRLQEIGSSEVVLENKQAQAAARKEYYILEQEMEKYHMALVMTDEYIEEQRRLEHEWEEDNRVANLNAVRLLRSAIPVDISRLSEKDLITSPTPTGTAFPAELARRLKRTNVLQLLRTDPKTIVKMHPSVIEGYRTTGLTLLERRALHHVLREPFHEWRKQQKDEMAQKKYSWYCKLKDAFVAAASTLQSHCESSGTTHSVDTEAVVERHTCKLLGLACPVRAEERVRKLYCGLGFSSEPIYFKEDILKSDPEGAGEKALLEAQGHAREVVANQRQRELKAHYRMNMREVAQAAGALEEMDAILDRVRDLDQSFPCVLTGESPELFERNQVSQCTLLLNCTRELALLLAKRAGICLTGKRDAANDEEDTRSPVEIKESIRAVDAMQQILDDMNETLFKSANGSLFAMALGTYRGIQELITDTREKNLSACERSHNHPFQSPVEWMKQRVPWKKRTSLAADKTQLRNNHGVATNSRGGKPSALPTSALLFDAIKARRKQPDRRTTEAGTSPKLPVCKPASLMDAIRARKRAPSSDTVEEAALAADAATSA